VIGVIDYGMGNLHSVEKALQLLGAPCRRLSSAAMEPDITALLLPGVGAFDPAMERLDSLGWSAALKTWTMAERPLLGICLGLQLLFDSSAEGSRQGLGLLQGRVEPLPPEDKERCPHMGWAPLRPGSRSPLISTNEPASWMYFVHSFAAVPTDANCITATAPYGRADVVAAVGRGQLQATQFHPEKSGRCGLDLLQRWLSSLD
tara:strand:+ start:228 stop:839 length:612 start_codon:yes stop_codon:yes gene_type:complete